MELRNFEEGVEERILTRGLSYYRGGNIRSLEHDGKMWTAVVEGSDDYKVTASLSEKGEISDMTCSCTHRWSKFCTHRAAVLYALREKAQGPGGKPVKNKGRVGKPLGGTASAPHAAKPIEDIVETLSRETLISIVLGLADRYDGIEEEIALRYSGRVDITGYARGVIQEAVKSTTGRRGHMAFGDEKYAVEGAEDVLEMADEKIDLGQTWDAVSLCITVLEEMMDLIENCEDYDGHVEGTIEDAIERIGEALSLCPLHEQDEDLFDLVLEHSLEPVYCSRKEKRIGIMSALMPLCAIQANRRKLEDAISGQYRTDVRGWGGEYDNRLLQALQHRIIKRFDGDAAAESYMEEHLDNSDFRFAAIEAAMQREMYDRALGLCLEGEEVDSRYAGLLNRYKDLRYAVYEKKGDVPAQKALGHELLLEGGRDYYPRLKALYDGKDWLAALEGILDGLEHGRQVGLYLDILIKEELKPRILEYCKAKTDSIVTLYAHLLPEHKKDVCAIFVKHIKESAGRARTRDSYRDVCLNIMKYRGACGNTAANAVRDELKRAYPKQPAFQDELSRV
ncbi:MAG: hypothetical protein FWH47_07440 [Methanomassiliicoccaceae archaeon]|nr:hypothetical protein [Methanomassiliicoccaceae archaeon]